MIALMKLILGSTSPNRKSLLDKMGFVYKIMSPDYEEIIIPDQLPVNQVQAFALGKAQSVYKKVVQDDLFLDDFCILGFDSMIAFEGGSLGKPKNRDDAFRMIQSFLGKSQEVVTGMSFVGKFKGKYFEKTVFESTPVKFRSDITDSDIEKYLEFGDWEGKCGAYSILGTGIFLLEKIEGDFQNIIGIPVMSMGACLEEITGQSVFSILLPS